jgi:nicotinamidase-related amidase
MLLPPGSKDAEMLGEFAPEPGKVVLNETTTSVFVSTHADVALRNMGIDTLIMTGAATNNCVESGTRGVSREGHDYAIRHLHANDAPVRSRDEMIAQIEIGVRPVRARHRRHRRETGAAIG